MYFFFVPFFCFFVFFPLEKYFLSSHKECIIFVFWQFCFASDAGFGGDGTAFLRYLSPTNMDLSCGFATYYQSDLGQVALPL